MKAINLLIAVHNHQAVGNLEEVFSSSWEKGYDPFLQMLEKHPAFRVSLHYSGALLEWLEENRPDFSKRLRALADREQIELLSGGFYEPLLPFIPEKDALGQVRLSNQYLAAKFQVRPQGFWLTERVWSPNLPKMMASTGLKYTIVDDSHFRYAGFSEEDISGYYVTEAEGFTLSVFPINQRMRYSTDSGHLAVTLDQFRRCQYSELGDFVNQPYALEKVEEPEGSGVLSVLLIRRGGLWGGEGKVPLQASKRFTFYRDQARLEVGYEIANRGAAET